MARRAIACLITLAAVGILCAIVVSTSRRTESTWHLRGNETYFGDSNDEADFEVAFDDDDLAAGDVAARGNPCRSIIAKAGTRRRRHPPRSLHDGGDDGGNNGTTTRPGSGLPLLDEDAFLPYEQPELETDEEFVCELRDGVTTLPIDGTDEQMSEMRRMLNSGELVSAESSVEVEAAGGGGDGGVGGGGSSMMMQTESVSLPPGAVRIVARASDGDGTGRIRRRRGLQSQQEGSRFEGKKLLLVVRVTDSEGRAVPEDAAHLSDKFFGTSGDRFTTRSGFGACSYGKLDMSAEYGYAAVPRRLLSAPGVVDVTIPVSLAESTQETISGESQRALMRKLGRSSLPGPFHHILFVVEGCYPVGTSCKFAAWAYMNHWLSLYVGDNYKYPAVVMHELGHNLNMAHSGGTDGLEYTDHTCLMGNPWFDDDYGRMCFNPVKNYQIGMATGSWFDKRHLAYFDSGTVGGTSWSGRLIGVADYADNPDGHPVVLKLETGDNSDWFVGFNRQAGINVDTRQSTDQVTLYRINAGNGRVYSASSLKGSLGEGRRVTIGNWRRSGLKLIIHVGEINTSARPGYAEVDVTFGPQPAPTGSPTREPTAEPSPGPTLSPSLRPSASPSAWPSGQPSIQSSRVPTGQPSGHPSTQPSAQPFSRPSTSPSYRPTDAPTAKPPPFIAGVCGNSVCDAEETIGSCPSDCVPRKFRTRSDASDSNTNGLMFTVNAIAKEVRITSFSVRSASSGKNQCHIYTRAGDYQGHETEEREWETIYEGKAEMEQGILTDLGSLYREVAVKRGSMQSFYIWCKKGVASTMDVATNRGVASDTDGFLEVTSGTTSQWLFYDTSGYGQFTGGISYYALVEATEEPTQRPVTQMPTMAPSHRPTAGPTKAPTSPPSLTPTLRLSTTPSIMPSGLPSMYPTMLPSNPPSLEHSVRPSQASSEVPSAKSSALPSGQPSIQSSEVPTGQSSGHPSTQPSAQPFSKPSTYPSSWPSYMITSKPSMDPSIAPTVKATSAPSGNPTDTVAIEPPSASPTAPLTTVPTLSPSKSPTESPIALPTSSPTFSPTVSPSSSPMTQPTFRPTAPLTTSPTLSPSTSPTKSPMALPTSSPTVSPTASPSSSPTESPTTQPTFSPTASPTTPPSFSPTTSPRASPTVMPSTSPTGSTTLTSERPTVTPTSAPSRKPTTNQPIVDNVETGANSRCRWSWLLWRCK